MTERRRQELADQRRAIEAHRAIIRLHEAHVRLSARQQHEFVKRVIEESL